MSKNVSFYAHHSWRFSVCFQTVLAALHTRSFYTISQQLLTRNFIQILKWGHKWASHKRKDWNVIFYVDSSNGLNFCLELAWSCCLHSKASIKKLTCMLLRHENECIQAYEAIKLVCKGKFCNWKCQQIWLFCHKWAAFCHSHCTKQPTSRHSQPHSNWIWYE